MVSLNEDKEISTMMGHVLADNIQSCAAFNMHCSQTLAIA